MTTRIKKILAGVAALAALALGGAVLAQAGSDDGQATEPASSAPAAENENDQAGDPGDAAEVETQGGEKSDDANEANDGNEAEDADEPGDVDQADDQDSGGHEDTGGPADDAGENEAQDDD
jgi:hypothetical protein